ncbi:MAG TPA: D-glycerate dehydrogenase [Dehalococcoidia bacterium]|nr:D-glycerate dehydrogenase [Dehalococcoidia bacterium]
MPRVFVTRRLVGDGLERLADAIEVAVWPEEGPPPPEALRLEARRSDGLLTLITDRVDAELLDAAPSVRIVSQMAVGYDNIDVSAATERGVLVTNTPGVLTETTADLAFALMLAVARRLPEGEAAVREGAWGVWSPAFLLGRDVFGKTLGIVGLGAIGAAVARRARGFDMRVLYTSRRRKPELEASLGLEWRPLADLLREADFVSIHSALTPETRGLIGAAELALMKPEAFLINTARGGLVDQEALVEALRARRIAGAGLDVFAVEPIPPQDPLLGLENVVVVPHVGSATWETRAKMTDLAVDNLLAFFRGERPPCCVNPEVLEGR